MQSNGGQEAHLSERMKKEAVIRKVWGIEKRRSRGNCGRKIALVVRCIGVVDSGSR